YKALVAFAICDIDYHNLFRPGQPRTLDGAATDAAAADHHDGVARAHLGGIDRRSPPGGDPAAKQAGTRERKVIVDLDDRAVRHGPVLGERAQEACRADVAVPDPAPIRPIELGAAQ